MKATALSGEPYVYLVPSSRNPAHVHRVEVDSFEFFGCCDTDCPHFMIRCLPTLEKVPKHLRPKMKRCSHLDAAREQYCEDQAAEAYHKAKEELGE